MMLEESKDALAVSAPADGGSTSSVRDVSIRIDVQSGEGMVAGEMIMESVDLQVHYGDFLAVRDVNLKIHRDEITALIGPSGCGKSTILRCFNRMNDLIPSAKVGGKIFYRGIDLYGPEANAGEVRRRIGMVFQKPNPFPKSIYDNVAFGPRVNGKPSRAETDELVERSLRRAALWDEVKDRLKQSAFSLSGGQQQRLCIARALAVNPEVLLMDEPCSALDPGSTLRIEETISQLSETMTVVIVTHNMQQASRVSDYCAFFLSDGGPGRLIETSLTSVMFTSPTDKRTEDYVQGRFG